MKDRLASIYIGITLVISTLTVVLMVVMGEPVQHKVTAQDASALSAEAQSGRDWYIMDEKLAENSFVISLPNAVEEQDIQVENDYRKKQFRIILSKISTEDGASVGVSKKNSEQA